jgi:hypothetical protein
VISNEEHILGRADGTSCVVRVSTAPVYDGDANLVAGVLVGHDITHEKEMEEQRARLAASQQAADAMRALMVSNATSNKPCRRGVLELDVWALTRCVQLCCDGAVHPWKSAAGPITSQRPHLPWTPLRLLMLLTSVFRRCWLSHARLLAPCLPLLLTPRLAPPPLQANVSHELRTPLHGITGFTDLLC